jgi:hypothetical protein
MTNDILKINYGLVCDAVRREDNGKLILIGVYGGNIGLPRFPATLILALVLDAESKQPGSTTLSARVRMGRKVIAESTGRVETFAAGSALISISGIVLRDLEKEGILKFEIQKNGGRWETVRAMPLVRSVNAN